MGKTATRKRMTSNANDPAQDYLTMFDARSQLVAASLNMGWQLALTVLIPLFIGVKLDQRFDTSPSLTLTALFIAIAGSAVLITRTFKDMSQQQALVDAANKTKRKTKKVKARTDA
ncbi:AtpZ/AtpI family protein [Candidatus Saccharibacteria bacterium]|nr:AtpZ/AtpI family protein [Candidatus Saccharibacteria bacterium]